ncbi:LuxR family transcriptional regulator [Micromonospora auratinigra]|uniref:LuxR family transcriptional regulator, maltose regulon positive regulatory protein n=1 Tax=Micromonospora auratinigra TaxID=261654 RepID=A0A1A8ZNY9_9ACTN|nr:LuxR C-terminal-related transcriptional regulator [Micromonospora auratinigra]SBT45582.1 LuxR family transcriptional regulator, maltose regulon positive regulatory protein [Micromonospora auratinigra]
MPDEADRVEVAEASEEVTATVPAEPVVAAPAAPPPLLASRLAAPAPPEPLLARPRLLDRLDRGLAGPVTLVSAPAGWGKTTLLAAWARHTGVTPAPAWVSVEDSDTGARLWSYLAAGLRAVGGDPADDGPRPPVPDGPPRPDQLELLAAALATREHPVLLVLDDLHRIADPAALAGLEFLLRHTEGRLRLVAGARGEPALALHRWRLAGELTEIGPGELAFTDDEVADLLVAYGVPVPAAAVPRLRARTGGWPAGLRYAVLALHGRADPARAVERFGGDQPDVARYLRDEVLAPLTPDTRDVLRRTAVAGAVCADLADALTGRPDAGQLLGELARSGGFVEADGGSPAWYRCHPLLADLLHDELGRRLAEERDDLHRRAATWYAAHGRPAEALRHALSGGDWDRATELLTEHWPELVPYEPDGVAGPAPGGPGDEALRRDPELGLACAAERAYAGDTGAAAGHLRRAVGLAADLPATRADRFRRVAGVLELTLARLAGDHDETRRAAERLRAAGPGEGPGAADVRAVAGTAAGLVALDEGRLPVAARWFAEARAAAREAGRSRTELVCASRAALLEAVRGRLRAAERTAREALDMPPCEGWSCRVDCGYAYLALALVAWHRDEPTEAAAHLALAGPALAEPVAGVLAALCRAELLAVRGEPAAALRTLAAAREVAAGPEPADWLTVGEAQLRALVGDVPTARALLTEARARLDPVPPPAGGPAAARPASAPAGEPAPAPPASVPTGEPAPASPVPAPAGTATGADAGPERAGRLAALGVALARVELRAGDPRAAGRALPDWAGEDAGSWPLAVRLAAGLLEAVVAHADGDDRRAGRVLERVLDLAEPEGYRRVFTRAEPGVRDLLAAHLDSGTAHWATVSDLVRGADERRADEPAERSDEPARPLDEPLTERELTILRYLQSILSNVEIAGELSLSVNTVKTHVRNIYRKLDATRRREAVRRARELRLI